MKCDDNSLYIVAVVCATVLMSVIVTAVAGVAHDHAEERAAIAKAACDQINGAILCRQGGGK